MTTLFVSEKMSTQNHRSADMKSSGSIEAGRKVHVTCFESHTEHP